MVGAKAGRVERLERVVNLANLAKLEKAAREESLAKVEGQERLGSPEEGLAEKAVVKVGVAETQEAGAKLESLARQAKRVRLEMGLLLVLQQRARLLLRLGLMPPQRLDLVPA